MWWASSFPFMDCEGLRLRGGRDFTTSDSNQELAAPPPSPPMTWLPPGVLGKGVRLRLCLDRHDRRGRGCWHLVNLEAESEPLGKRLKSPDPDACIQSKEIASIQHQLIYLKNIFTSYDFTLTQFNACSCLCVYLFTPSWVTFGAGSDLIDCCHSNALPLL